MSIIRELKKMLLEIYSQWEYKPADFYHSIYDFYALSLINPNDINDEDLSYAFKEAKQTMVNYMEKFLLEQLERVVSTEITHYLHFKKFLSSNVDYSPKYLKFDISKRFFKEYVNYFNGVGHPDVEKLSNMSDGKRYSDVFGEMKDFMKEKGFSISDLFMFGKDAFSDISGWKSDQYGGKKWANIADAGLQVLDMKNSNDVNKKMAVLDYIMDLQHNTGSIFLKDEHLKTYDIKKILDDKRDIKNVMGYYNKVSPNLKEPYAAAIKSIYGKSVEAEEQNISQEEIANKINRNPFNIINYKNPSKEIQMIAVKKDPMSLMYIDDPDIEVIEYAVKTDYDVYKMMGDKKRNKLSKEFVQDLFGGEWEAKPKKKDRESDFKEL
jgi:hypothetical protein